MAFARSGPSPSTEPTQRDIDTASKRGPALADIATCCGALGALPLRAIRPRRPDTRFLRSLQVAAAPRSTGAVRLTAIVQSRYDPLAMGVADGMRRPRRLSLAMTTFLVEHPQARFLVDPAMCRDVHERVLPGLQVPLRWAVAPPKPVISLTQALADVGRSVDEIDFALPTHLHWDHVAGLAELPGLPVRVTEIERAHALDGTTVPTGYVRAPLCNRRFHTYDLDGPPVLTFARSHDLFGDGAVVLVDLAGHTPGSVGVLLATEGGGRVLLAGDAAWHGIQVRLLREKGRFPGALLDHDRDRAFEAVHRLHALPGDIEVVAGHDRGAAERWTS